MKVKKIDIIAINIPDVYFDKGDPLPDKYGYIDNSKETATVEQVKDIWLKLNLTIYDETNIFQQEFTTSRLSVKYKNRYKEIVTDEFIFHNFIIDNNFYIKCDGSDNNPVKVRLKIYSSKSNYIILETQLPMTIIQGDDYESI